MAALNLVKFQRILPPSLLWVHHYVKYINKNKSLSYPGLGSPDINFSIDNINFLVDSLELTLREYDPIFSVLTVLLSPLDIKIINIILDVLEKEVISIRENKVIIYHARQSSFIFLDLILDVINRKSKIFIPPNFSGGIL